MPELACVTATVYGKVQGVFYRAFTSRVAKSLSLKGYARNLSRFNAVEIYAEGEKEKLEEFIRQLEIGPPEALVDKIDIKWAQFTGQFSQFEVRY
ncbi:MAG: acylphosphatase [Chloroflexi bacterium]|nr:acylphosphatase [Chloroflexota bacterium]MBM3155401.1 acylphosphatase [Chloroflexota bacterium]MBM3173696.1 acylphosphatase [Chloroflexota bacterium]MBM3176054.1 acylphosphatase [Chloroflexota bacterium]MBM4450596.1 acylphosphatase [Chloroflexota bacterium]